MVIAGNIATGAAAEALINASADGVKVGRARLDLYDPRRRRNSASHRSPPI